MGKMDIFTLRVTAKQVSRRRVMLKLATVVGGIATLLLLIFYGMAIFAREVGSFTVNVPEGDSEYNIALSENPEFEESFNKLSADPLDEMDNITESNIAEDVDSGAYYGSHNGMAYIAYTFYVKNVSESENPITYLISIDIEEIVLSTDEAIRIKVYHNGVPTVYAKSQKDSLEAEPNTTPFYSSKQVMCTERTGFKKGEIDKFTIVIWLEGNDPECTDEIRGGKIKFSMNFSVKNTKEEKKKLN